MTYQEQQLATISKSLKEISKALQQMLVLSSRLGSCDRSTTSDNDCGRCLCNSCANIESCNAKKDEVLTEFRAAPCNGCQNGQRYMPIESAHCPDYKLRE